MNINHFCARKSAYLLLRGVVIVTVFFIIFQAFSDIAGNATQHAAMPANERIVKKNPKHCVQSCTKTEQLNHQSEPVLSWNWFSCPIPNARHL